MGFIYRIITSQNYKGWGCDASETLIFLRNNGTKKGILEELFCLNWNFERIILDLKKENNWICKNCLTKKVRD